jgi:DNA-binding XRE family transcriptional regulator
MASVLITCVKVVSIYIKQNGALFSYINCESDKLLEHIFYCFKVGHYFNMGLFLLKSVHTGFFSINIEAILF